MMMFQWERSALVSPGLATGVDTAFLPIAGSILIVFHAVCRQTVTALHETG